MQLTITSFISFTFPKYNPEILFTCCITLQFFQYGTLTRVHQKVGRSSMYRITSFPRSAASTAEGLAKMEVRTINIVSSVYGQPREKIDSPGLKDAW